MPHGWKGKKLLLFNGLDGFVSADEDVLTGLCLSKMALTAKFGIN
jgi:hypothetical protein